MVAGAIQKYLRLVFQPAKRGRVNDAIAVTLIFTAPLRRSFSMHARAGTLRLRGIARDFKHAFAQA
jgi:hypothetical protein